MRIRRLPTLRAAPGRPSWLHARVSTVPPSAMVCVGVPTGLGMVVHRRCACGQKGFPRDLACALDQATGPLVLVFQDETHCDVYAMARVVS